MVVVAVTVVTVVAVAVVAVTVVAVMVVAVTVDVVGTHVPQSTGHSRLNLRSAHNPVSMVAQ